MTITATIHTGHLKYGIQPCQVVAIYPFGILTGLELNVCFISSKSHNLLQTLQIDNVDEFFFK